MKGPWLFDNEFHFSVFVLQPGPVQLSYVMLRDHPHQIKVNHNELKPISFFTHSLSAPPFSPC